MALNAIETFNELRNAYGDYLRSQFNFRDEELNEQSKDLLNKSGELINGPYVEATTPYKTAETLIEMVNNNLLSKDIGLAFNGYDFNEIKRYSHQTKAITKIINGSNVVIASGTGSGKTECFLVPIFNHIMREYESGKLNKGVRALLVYPMNALANDQMDRLRVMLEKLPYITFGRYIGETKDNRDEAIAEIRTNYPNRKILKNEKLSRKEMQDSPPHILVTNYAMLEYMLIRPKDNPIFEDNLSNSWKFIVLDEAHTYKGAQGAEVGMLIRRLKERVIKNDRKLSCIATSATLGGSQDDLNKIAQFATALFSEPFLPSNVIMSEKESIPLSSGKPRDFNFYLELSEMIKKGSSTEELKTYCEIKGDFISIEGILYCFLIKDPLMYKLRGLITKDVLKLFDLPYYIFGEQNPEDVFTKQLDVITALIDLGAKAKLSDNSAPILSAKYHVFAKALEGAFISFYPEKKLLLNRYTELDGHPVYELTNCIRCGQEYIMGEETYKEDGHPYLTPSSRYNADFYMLKSEGFQVIEEDEDELLEEIDTNPNEYILCSSCGRFYQNGEEGIGECCREPLKKLIKLIKTPTKSTCLWCGRNQSGTIRKLISDEDSSTEVLARKLYQSIPAEITIKSNEEENDSGIDFFSNHINKTTIDTHELHTGRKLLMFSDNRQEAAFFAVYMQRRYEDILWRHIILDALENLRTCPEISFKDLRDCIIQIAEKYKLFERNMTLIEKSKLVSCQLMHEFIESESRISLRGLGLIDIYIDIAKIIPDPLIQHIAKSLEISYDESKLIYPVLFDMLRRQGIVDFPDQIDPRDEFFAPRNRKYMFKTLGNDKGNGYEIFGWLPSKPYLSNRRHNYLQRILESKGAERTKASLIAGELLKQLFNTNGKAAEHFINEGVLKKVLDLASYQLDYTKWRFRINESTLYRCDKCGSITQYNINNICPEFKCDGNLVEHNQPTMSRQLYYINTYKNMKEIPMVAEEHTAQLKSQRATEIQNLFKCNKVNILSCSTTFEMGVDIGDLEAVLLRNVPPETSNYIQRSGRAGRRNSAAAFILTYARRRSHDLTFFNEPAKMIKGIIKPPYIEINNENIVRRHIHSVVMAWFFRKHDMYFGKVEALLGDGEKKDIINALNIELSNKPADLYQSLNKIIPDAIKKTFDIDNWRWLEGFIEPNSESSIPPALIKAMDELIQSISELDGLEHQYIDDKKYKSADYVKRIKDGQLSRDTISFLSKYGVLPRYGFPVDVVPLEILHHSEVASYIELDRDLKMAITEYAPGNQVVASGATWKPYAVKLIKQKGWPTYLFAICKQCGKLYTKQAALGETRMDLENTCCGTVLKYQHFIIPIYGFTTKREDAPERAKETRTDTYYTSKVYFNGFEDEDVTHDVYDFPSGKGIYTEYASRGKLTIINNGIFGSMPFRICENCGYVKYDLSPNTEHYTPLGVKCGNRSLKPVFLAHSFLTDTLRITIRNDPASSKTWLSLLYTLIEGSCYALEIDRRELGGCLWYSGQITSPDIILYDSVPGGAGHVKRVQKNIKEVIDSAFERINGKCGCGPETSCYGCLRNYDNQIYHEELSRGAAFDFLKSLIGDK